MSDFTYIAIDPGKNGAVAVSRGGCLLTVDKTPGTLNDMRELLQLKISDTVRVVIEKVASMPGNGSVSMFSFGQNFGQWQGIIAALQLPCIEVPPKQWQKLIGALPKDKKERKNKILDYTQKRTGAAIRLYAADAVAMALVAPQLWEGER